MDMWGPYIASTREHVPGAEHKIAFDKFHVAKHLGDAVQQVRREENRALIQHGDERLKGTRFLWNTNPENMPRQTWIDFQALRLSALKTVSRLDLQGNRDEPLALRSPRGWAL